MLTTDPEDVDHIELVGGEGGVPLEDCGGVHGLGEAVALVEAIGRGEKLTEDEGMFVEALFGQEPGERERRSLLEFDADAVRRGLAQIPLDPSASAGT